MGFDDTIRAGNPAALERCGQEGRAAIEAALNEANALVDELKNKKERVDKQIKALKNAIDVLTRQLKEVVKCKMAAAKALAAAQAQLSVAPSGSREQQQAANEVARCNADVKLWEARQTRILDQIKEFEDKKKECERQLAIILKRLTDADGQAGALRARLNDYEARKQAEINRAVQIARSYPGGR